MYVSVIFPVTPVQAGRTSLCWVRSEQTSANRMLGLVYYLFGNLTWSLTFCEDSERKVGIKRR